MVDPNSASEPRARTQWNLIDTLNPVKIKNVHFKHKRVASPDSGGLEKVKITIFHFTHYIVREFT